MLASVASLVLGSLLPLAAPQSLPASRTPGVQPFPTNLYGAPVVATDGKPIVYSQSELQAQLAEWLARDGHLGEVGPSACESSVAQADWKYYALGTGIGEGNIAVSTVQGVTEIVVACGGSGFGGNRYWMILHKKPGVADYTQAFVSPDSTPGGLRWLETANLDADVGPEIALIFVDGTVEIWDQATRKLQGTFQTITSVAAMHLSDVDADGVIELIVANASSLHVYSPDGAHEWFLPGAGGSDIAVGQMDDDAALEIATTSGKVVDAQTHQAQWTWPSGFGAYLEAGDIDNDGKDELIGTQIWDFAWAYDVDAQLPKWSLPLFNVGATALADMDGDGRPELIVGDAQWGAMRAFDTASLALKGSVNNPEHGTTEVVVGDPDSDGKIDVLWGAGHSSSGPDHLYFADWQTKQIEWQNVHLDGPFRGPARGDVDGDGDLETVAVSNQSDAGYGAGRILVFDDQLELLAISQDVGGGLGWSGTWEVVLRNVDADAALEIVVPTSTTYDGTIEIYDYNAGGTFTLIWEVPNPKPSGAFLEADVLDVDHDGQLEVVGCAGQYVYAYDFATGAKEWQSLAVLSGATEIEVGHTDYDPGWEVLALGSDGDVRVFDGESGAIEALIPGNFTCLGLIPLSVLPDLLQLGDDLGALHTFQFIQGSGAYLSAGSVQLLDEPLESVTFGNGGTLWASSSGVLSLFYPPYDDPLWISCSVYGKPFGHRTVYGADCLLTAGANGLVAFRRYQGN
jgi:WD40 repeat protein